MWSKISPVISSSEPRSVLMHSMPVPQIRTILGPVLSIQGALLQTLPPFYFTVAFPLFSVLLGILCIWHVFMPNPNYPLFSILLPKGPSLPPIFDSKSYEFPSYTFRPRFLIPMSVSKWSLSMGFPSLCSPWQYQVHEGSHHACSRGTPNLAYIGISNFSWPLGTDIIFTT